MPAAYREKNDRGEGGRLSTTFGYFSGKANQTLVANRIELKQAKVRPSVFLFCMFMHHIKNWQGGVIGGGEEGRALSL